jgi:outer membrane protein assembly factor BamB
LFYRPDRVDALSLEGRTLWTLRLPAPIYQVPARWTGPPAPEWQFLTEDKSLWSVGDSGAVLRRVRLAFLPTLVCPAHTDGDGRVDSVLLGYGVQRAPSTRTLWARSLSNNGRARPVAVQVGDSTHVLYQDRWDDTGTKSLRSFDGKTGREIWRLQAGMDPIRAPTLHDWDRDGSPEAWIFSHSQGGVRGVQVVRVSDGSILATFPEPIDDPYAPVVPVDADGDGSLEAAVFGYRHGYRLLGRDRPEPLAASRVGAVRPPLWTPVLADVDGDRRPEILCAWVGESDGAITALRTDGTVAWQLDVPDDVRSEPALADLDADGAPELLVSGRRDIFVLSLDGRLRSTWAGCGSGLGGLSILDVDGDGRLEVLHATTTGAALLRADGSAVWRAPDARIRGRLSVAETPSGRLALGVDRDGRLHALDLATGKPRWFADLGGWSEGGPTIADVTGDGIPEALVAGAWLGFVVIDLR